MRGGDKKKACDEFLQAAQLGESNSRFIPMENLTPFSLYNSSTENKNKILDALKTIDNTTLLVILLGEDKIYNLVDDAHNIFGQEFVTSFPGKISVLSIDPENSDENSSIPESLKEKVISIKVSLFLLVNYHTQIKIT